MARGAARSPAVRILNDHGVRVIDLAVVAGTTPATISRWLAGIRQHPDHLKAVLERFLGESATEVLAAIPEVRRAS